MIGRRRAATWALYGLTLAAVFSLALTTLTRYDFWWSLKSGELILETRAVPRTDPFSYTAEGRPWVNHMWATQVLLVLGWRHGGRVAVLLAKAVLVSATFAVVLLTMRTRSVPPLLAAGVCLVGAWAGLGFWEVRPQLVTYLFAAVCLWVLREGWTRRFTPWWAMPLLMIPWANLHAGFVTGFGLIGIVGLGTALPSLVVPERRGEGWRTLGRALGLEGLAALGSLVNPFGVRAMLFPLEVVRTKAFVSSTLEWLSPNFHNPVYHGFEGMLLLVLPAVAWGRAGLSLTDLFLLGGLAHLGLLSLRHVPLFAVAAAPPLAVGLGGFLGRLLEGAWWLPPLAARLRPALPSLGRLAALPGFWLASGAGTIALALALYWGANLGAPGNPLTLDLVEDRYPRAALTFIDEQRLPAPLFNVYVWAGYELWRLYPRYRVFIDGRTHVYGPEVLADFLAVANASPQWAAVLDRWKIQTILAPRPSVLAEVLTAVGGWRRVFAGGGAIVFVRDVAENRALFDRLGERRGAPSAVPPGSRVRTAPSLAIRDAGS